MKTTRVSTPIRLALAIALISFGASASAAIVAIDVNGVESWDAFGDSDNTVLEIDLAAALGGTAQVHVTGIGWNVGIDTVGDSWLSEAIAALQDSAGSSFVNLTPGVDDTMAGSGVYDSGGIVDLVGLGLDFTLVDGTLRLEFFESFDDVDGSVDAMWSGSLEVQASLVPVPPAVALMVSGLAALGFGFRRRA